MQNTNNSFTRWMDDITIGVEDKKQAIETISAISDMLKSRGLALNLSKTNIYDEDQGYYHFQIEENRYIDSFEKTTIDHQDYEKISIDIYERFQKHFENQDARYWDKVTKRYITLLTRLESPHLLEKVNEIYVNYPGLREYLLYYLLSKGYNDETANIISEIIEDIDVFDDISLYQICNLLTQWEIPLNEESKLFLNNIEGRVTKFSFDRRIPSDFYCVLWFKAKYNHPEDLMKFIQRYKNIWQSDTFLRRQVTAILSRLLIVNSKSVEELLYSQISSGIPNTVTLASQIMYFKDIEKLDAKLQMYLFPTKKQRPYPLNKFIVLCSVLNSQTIRNNHDIKDKVLLHIKDPYYLRWLDSQYNIS